MTHELPDPIRDPALARDYESSVRWLFAQTRAGAPRDPSRMARLVDELELGFPPQAIHVVGTNGKGTVTAMTAAAATASGVRSGSFTSPHVEDFRERIAVDGERIGAAEVVAFVDRVRRRPPSGPVAFFELCLALALEHFRARGVQFAAFEAGVGARFDATIVLENVGAVAVGPIALDHLATLGPTLADIALDKAYALRPGVPALSATQQPEATAVLERMAALRGSPLRMDAANDPLFEPPPGLVPTDMVRQSNRRLAAAVLRSLGWIPEEALRHGLSIPPLPGRGEVFDVGGVEVILDGAHDPSAAAALAERAGPGYVLLFGSLSRKQGEATLEVLESRAGRVFVTAAAGEAVTVAHAPERTVVDDPSRALSAALAACPPGGRLVIAGSLYLAGELRPVLRDLSASPARVT